MADLSERFIQKLREQGIKVVAFDMDLTIVRMHSRGSMTKERVHEYISCITEDFKTIVPLLAKEGFHLAIATHSDRAEYDFLGHDPEVFLLGEDLVMPVLAASVPDYMDQFYIFAYNPDAREATDGRLPENAAKKLHIRKVAAHYGVDTRAILLLDDDPHNVSDTDNLFHTFHINHELGFSLADFLDRYK